MKTVLGLAVRLKRLACNGIYLGAVTHAGMPMITADSKFVRRVRRPDAVADLSPHVRLLSEPLEPFNN